MPWGDWINELPTAFLLRGTAKDRKKGNPRLIGTTRR